MPDIKMKDPAARKPYRWNWSVRFPNDPVAASTFTVPVGVTLVTSSYDAGGSTAWLEGGTNGQDYTIVNRVTTAAGITDEWSLILKVRNQ